MGIRVVKTLLEGGKVRTTTTENNQTALSLALSKGRYGVVRVLPERGNVNSNTGARGGQLSFLPSPRDGDECVVEMRFRNHLNIGIAGFNNQPSAKNNHWLKNKG